ncbi:MAG: hypothetical protein IPJ07_10400 [Acidobacteria bacterium]|nr:hypothetical protein [Acidobacteriota bacterium]
MKKQTLMLVAMIAMVISSMVVSNAAVAPNLMADIPFDFIAENRTMPAGRYTISETSTRGVIEVSSFDKNTRALVHVSMERGSKRIEASHLEFRRYGDRYFLSTVKTDGLESWMLVPESSNERKAAQDAKYLAGRDVKPQIVQVQAKK